MVPTFRVRPAQTIVETTTKIDKSPVDVCGRTHCGLHEQLRDLHGEEQRNVERLHFIGPIDLQEGAIRRSGLQTGTSRDLTGRPTDLQRFAG